MSESSSAPDPSTDSGAPGERRLAYLFGIAFVAIILVVALFVPEPSPFQLRVFQVVLALAAAGVATTISGFLRVEVSSSVKAGGAIGVFVVVFFFSPAKLITSEATNGSDGTAPPTDSTQVDPWAPSAVTEYDDVICRTLQSEDLELRRSSIGEYFSVLNAGNPIAASVSESTAEEMLKLARRHTHQCIIGLGTDHSVTYWYGDAGAEVAPPKPDLCFAYVPGNLDFGPTSEGNYMIGTAEDGVMLTLASQQATERVLALAKDHQQLCFLGFEAYVRRDADCGPLTSCWTMFWRES